MATRASYLKIGLFVMLGAGAFLALGILIGLNRIHRETISYYTYFNEAVTGLDVGAPVRARGVPIGQVGNITFAPDHRMVEVRSDLDIDSLERLGFRKPGIRERIQLPPDLRAQLGTQGLTGVRFIALDLFDEKTNPPPVLSFRPQENYIPAARSVQKSLEDAARRAMEGVASLVETLTREELSEKVVQTTAQAHEVFTLLHKILDGFDQQKFPQRTSATVDEVRVALDKINKILDRVDGDRGLVASTQRSVSAIGEAGRQATDTTRSLNDALEEIRAAAAAIRLLADQLEREPDMLLKGRAKGRSP